MGGIVYMGTGRVPRHALPPGCSVSPTLVEIEENTNRSEPLANLTIPDGQQVVLGPSTTAGAFWIAGTELFLNVVPDYEVRAAESTGRPEEHGPRWLAGPQGLSGHSFLAPPPAQHSCVPQATPWLQAELQCFRGSTLVSLPARPLPACLAKPSSRCVPTLAEASAGCATA